MGPRLWFAACTIVFVAASVGLGLVLWVAWLLFALFAFEEIGCDGPCQGVASFTYDYAWLTIGAATVVMGLLLLPYYRRQLQNTERDGPV